MTPITQDQIGLLSEGRAKWSLSRRGKALRTELDFHSFFKAWSFMTEIAIIAEKMDHHPEWLNVYSKVEIELTTHDADGLTDRDCALANAISDALSGREFDVWAAQ